MLEMKYLDDSPLGEDSSVNLSWPGWEWNVDRLCSRFDSFACAMGFDQAAFREAAYEYFAQFVDEEEDGDAS